MIDIEQLILTAFDHKSSRDLLHIVLVSSDAGPVLDEYLPYSILKSKHQYQEVSGYKTQSVSESD